MSISEQVAEALAAPASKCGEKGEFKPRILAFCCNWYTYAGADLAGLNRMQYPADVRLLRVPCSGRVNPQFVLKALQGGCDGVLVCDDYCAPLIAKYALEHVSEGKVGLVARGCEARAVNRFVADHQLKRDQVYVLGLPCSGMKDPETGEELKRCAECQKRNPVVFDEMLADEVEEPKPNRFAEVDRIEAMGREERRAYFDNVYSACIRCYACRNACPVCTCRECFVEQERVGWQGKEHNVDEARFYGLTRAFHVGDRCIECGECDAYVPCICR